MKNRSKNKKASKEERIISLMLTISIVVVALTGGILAKFFTSPEAYAVIGILSLVAFVCFISVWIATTISLRNR